MLKRTAIVATLACASSTSALAALEGWTLYEDFAATTINADKWGNQERERSSSGTGVLRLRMREMGSSLSDTGSRAVSHGISVTKPGKVTQLRAGVRINSVAVTGCAANPLASTARARLLGSFFQTGTPSLGSFVGDVIAQIQIQRASNSTDAAGVLRITGTAVVCGDADCNIGTNIGAPVELGTVNVGTWEFVLIEHDAAAKTFTFGRANGAQTGTIAYALSNDTAPARDFKGLNTRTVLASCASGPRSGGAIDASFTKVRVNASAL